MFYNNEFDTIYHLAALLSTRAEFSPQSAHDVNVCGTINLLNLDPLDRFGPLPFEIEIGTRWYVPIITKYSFGYTSTWIRISSYFQAW